MTGSLIAVNSTNVCRVHGLVDHEGVFQNDAVVTLEELVTARGTPVVGLIVPLTLDYVTGSNGNYEALISHNVSLVVSMRYKAKFLAVGSQGYRREWIEPVRCEHGEA